MADSRWNANGVRQWGTPAPSPTVAPAIQTTPTTPIVGNINGGGSWSSGVTTPVSISSPTQSSTPNNPITSNIQSNPTYQSPASSGGYTPQQQQPAIDATAYINKLFEAQTARSTALLDKQRQNTIAGLDRTKTKISPYYTQQRNTLAGTSQQNARNFAEYLANRGQSRSGASEKAESMRINQLQAGLGGLGQDEAMAMSDIENKKQLADQNYFSDLTATENQLIGQMNDKLYNEYVRGEDYKYKLSEAAKDDKYKQDLFGLQKQQFDFNKGQQDFQNNITTQNQVTQNMKDSNDFFGGVSGEDLIAQMAKSNPKLLGNYKAMQNQDGGYQAGINQAMGNNDQRTAGILTALRNEYLRANPTNQYANTIGGNTFIPTLQGQQQALVTAGMVIENAMKNIQLENLPAKEQYALLMIKTEMEKGNLVNAKMKIENSALPDQIKMELDKGIEQIASSKANTAQGYARIANDTAQVGTSNLKQDAFENKQLNDAVSQLDKLFVVKEYGTNIPKITGDASAMRANIISRNLPDDITDALLTRYGLPTN